MMGYWEIEQETDRSLYGGLVLIRDQANIDILSDIRVRPNRTSADLCLYSNGSFGGK